MVSAAQSRRTLVLKGSTPTGITRNVNIAAKHTKTSWASFQALDQSNSFCQSDFVLLHLAFRLPLTEIVRMNLAIDSELAVKLPHEQRRIGFGSQALKAAKLY